MADIRYSKGSDFMVMTSRGRFICEKIELLENMTVGRYFKGAKLVKLVDNAISLVEEHRRSYTETQRIHKDIVTVVGGLPDITSIKFGRKYQEATFDHWESDQAYRDHLDRVKLSFHEAAERLERIDVLPVFATVIPFHIKTWNTHRKTIGATSYLTHEKNYPNMQRRLNQMICEINKFIITLNKNHDPSLVTPDLAQFHVKSQGESRKPSQRHRYIYNGMKKDGCHPNDPKKCPEGKSLVNDWYEELSNKQRINRMSTASEKAIRVSMGC